MPDELWSLISNRKMLMRLNTINTRGSFRSHPSVSPHGHGRFDCGTQKVPSTADRAEDALTSDHSGYEGPLGEGEASFRIKVRARLIRRGACLMRVSTSARSTIGSTASTRI